MATKIDGYGKICDLRNYLESKGFFKVETDNPVEDFEEITLRHVEYSKLAQEIYFSGLDRMMEISLEITSGNKEN